MNHFSFLLSFRILSVEEKYLRDDYLELHGEIFLKYRLSREKAFSAVLSVQVEHSDLFDHTIHFPPNNVRKERAFQQVIQRDVEGRYRRRRRKNIKESTRSIDPYWVSSELKVDKQGLPR